MLRAQLAAALGKGRRGAHEVHVAGDRLDHQAGDVLAVQREGLFELLQVVVLEHQRVLHHLGRHAGRGRVAEGGQARAGLHQQRVGMAVVAAFELDDGLAAGGAARQVQRAHRGFGARTHEAHHRHRRHEGQDGFGQLDLALGRRAVREAFEHGFLHRLDHGGMAVAQDHRAPGADVVDVTLVVGVPEIGALCALDETGRAADGLEGAHGRVHAAGDHGAGALEKKVVLVSHQCRVSCGGKAKSGGVSGASSSSSSSSGSAQNRRSGSTWPMPGRKPASRQRSM
ncbi:hypothetical protein D3C72_954670 [compost metagenome]